MSPTPPPFPNSIEVATAFVLCLLAVYSAATLTNREVPSWVHRGARLLGLAAGVLLTLAIWIRFGQ